MTGKLWFNVWDMIQETPLTALKSYVSRVDAERDGDLNTAAMGEFGWKDRVIYRVSVDFTRRTRDKY